MTSSYWWIIPLTSLIAAALGAGAAFTGLVWRYRADYKLNILRELLATIQTAADISSEYWLLDPSLDDKETVNKCRHLEARILGYSERLESDIDAARPHLKRIDTLGMDIPWAKYLDGLTGGQFGDPSRPQDGERAVDVQLSAANLIRDLRIATDRTLFTL